MSTHSQTKNPSKGVDGTIFGLFPESSRSLYEECVASLANDHKDPEIKVASTLDSNVTSVAAATSRIKNAEVVIADVTDQDFTVMCGVGIACGLKEAKKIILLRSRTHLSESPSELPLDLGESFTIQEYETDDLVQLRSDLAATLNDSLRNPAPVEPIEDPFVRQTVEKAITNTHAQEWDVADILFSRANAELENHWYIHMQWGVMHREKGEDYDAARKHLKIAEKGARFSEHKAQVLIERAILAFHQKEASEAERLFTEAKNIHKKNRQLYIVWADIYDRLRLPDRALSQILDLMREVGKDSEAQLLTRYYTAKINDKNFQMSIDAFRSHERRKAEASQAIKPGHSEQSEKKGDSLSVQQIPSGLSWSQFRHRFEKKTVFGTVRNVHPNLGVFIFVGDFKGLLHKNNARSSFKTWYREGKEVKIKIHRVYKKQGKQAIDLLEAS